MREPVWPEPGAPAPAEKPPLGPMRILPALTPEEWANEGHCTRGGKRAGVWVYRPSDMETVVVGFEGESGIAIDDDALHAVAALALYGQPFGFTHEDVRVLRGLASWVPREWQPDGERVLRSLADRIEALLPPEVPNA